MSLDIIKDNSLIITLMNERVKKLMAQKDFQTSEKLILIGLKINNSDSYLNSYLLHSKLLQGKFKEVKDTYKQSCKKAFDPLNSKREYNTFGEAYLKDFEDLEKAGAIPAERKKDVEKIKKMLYEE
jgi:hypothetical protein